MAKTTEEIISTLKEISADMAKDAKDFDGQPFNGKTVATYLGYQGAAISAIAELLAQALSDKKL